MWKLGEGSSRDEADIQYANISVYLGCCGASCAWFHLHFWNSLSNPHVAWWDGFPASLTWEPEKLLSKWDAPNSIRLGQLLDCGAFEWIQSAVAIWRCWFLTCSLLVYNGYCHAGSFIYKDDYIYNIYMYLYFYVFILIYLNNIFILQFMWGTYEPPLSLKNALLFSLCFWIFWGTWLAMNSPALRPAPHDLALSLLVRAPGVGYEMHTHR